MIPVQSESAVFDEDKVQIVRRGTTNISEITEIFSGADIVFLEGFKNSEYPKIWMCSDEKFDNIKNIIAWIGECENSPKFCVMISKKLRNIYLIL